MKNSHLFVISIAVMIFFWGTLILVFPTQIYSQVNISGIIFNDLNGNGRRDPGEPGIKGWHIQAVGPISRYRSTDDTGAYFFEGLPVGSYTISEDPNSGWVQTMPPPPGTYTIQISSDTPFWDAINFGDCATRIRGIKFNDLNANGRRDPGEPGIKSWHIHVTGPVNKMKSTNDSGGYSFDNLPEGTYSVSEDSKNYWNQTMPPPPGTYTIQISSETPVWDTINFGDYTGRVSGIKFDDLNANGRQDPGEPGLRGWRIWAKGPRNRSALTNSEGIYSISELPAGNYQVYEAMKSGWVQTMPSPPGVYNIQISSDTPARDSINFGNSEGMRFNQKVEGMGFKIPTDAKLMTRNLACDTGDIYLCGYSNGGNTRMDYVTIKYENVTQGWVARYNNSAKNMDDKAYALAMDKNNGSVYVTGESYGGTSQVDIATVKYDANGVEQWVARWSNATNNGRDAGYGIALNQSGTIVFVTGETWGGSTKRSDYITIAYNAITGAKLWEATYNGPGSKVDKAYAIALAANGNPVVTGESDGGTTKADYATIMYDGATGAQLWVARYDARFLKRDYAFAIKADNAGNVYVTGASEGSRGYDYATIKYNALGDSQWVRRYDNGGRRNYGYDLVLDSSGNVYVTGASQGSRGVFAYATVKYDPAGVQVWANRYLSGLSIARSIDINEPEKKIFVTGSSNKGAIRKIDYLTQKIDAITGATEWVTSYNGRASNNDIAYNVKVCPSGENIVVTGTSFGGGTANIDLFTLQMPSGTSTLGVIEIPGMYADEEAYEGSDADLENESDEQINEVLPAKFALAQNYPNPFNPLTTIPFNLPEPSIVTLKVYNVLGQEVAKLLDNEVLDEGTQDVVFTAARLASGVYFYRLEATSVTTPGKTFTSMRKMVFMK